MARGNFGERLKREREMREVSLEEITSATRIGTRFLEALESEDWNKLPGGVFNRGFVRAVARYLGLDEESLLAEYDLARGRPGVSQTPGPAARRASELAARVATALLTVLVLLVLVVGGYVGWRHLRTLRALPETSPAPPAAPQAMPTTGPTSPPSDTSASSSAPAPLQLTVFPSDTVRVQILADGKTVLDKDLHPGETLHFEARSEFIVSASNSSAVLLDMNGQTMPPLGAPGASGRIVLTQNDLNRALDGNAQP
jgi:cytoskeletal protein RodZ